MSDTESINSFDSDCSEACEKVEDEVVGKWVQCVFDSDYEIFDQLPYPIRRINADWTIAESIGNHGYYCCKMNQKQYLKHRIIAEQFISNPDNKPCVDHISREKTDNRIENLRWVTSSENNSNRTKSTRGGVEYEYVEDIDDESIYVQTYGRWKFDSIFFHDNVFFFFNGINFRKLHVNEDKRGYKFVNTADVDGVLRAIYYSKFKREYDLI